MNDLLATTYMVFTVILGSAVGSFLNVCIYRLPLSISVNNPRRSFCPSCKKQIPFYFNLPIISWLMLKGKCAFCQKKISPRYLLIELLTAILFLIIWLNFPPFMAIAYWIMISFFIIAVFIDFEHMIIPDSISLGCAICGIISSALVPELQGENLWYKALAHSLFGAIFGFTLIYTVVILGKLAFGRKKIKFDKPENWSIYQDKFEEEDTIVFELEGDKNYWHDIFYRKNDLLLLTCQKFKIDNKNYDCKLVKISSEKIILGNKKKPLSDIKKISGKCSEITIPREAMGFGDVKFTAGIGAFLGWQATIFAMIGGSFFGLLGAFIAFIMRKEARQIPFGPYLALGALTWLFFGKKIIAFYQNWFFNFY